ncbi:MAG TPA: hypothetical protein GXX75_21365 [Clostridiales bacterium]|nr:hypothetical protein [Clostridiales bacterium]
MNRKILNSSDSIFDESYPVPTELLTTGIKNPLALDPDNIQFTWQMNSIKRGDTQTAYQILVASSLSNINRDQGDVWDSGKIHSSLSAAIKYDKKNLVPAKRYWWKVRIWDKDHEVSPYSACATFDTGLEKSDWTASYLWDGTTNPNNFAYFRKRFSILKKAKMAKVFVSAHNDYQLFLNGQELGRGPARSNPYKYGQYNAYEVTHQLSLGENAFAAIGHWHGVWNDSGINASPAFILEARIEYLDGGFETIGTDDTWKVLAATPYQEYDPAYFGLYGGIKNRAAIQYDARRMLENWTDVYFNDAVWEMASTVDRSDYNLHAQLVAQDREQQELVPVKVTPSGNDWLVEFDRCINGWPMITMRNNQKGSIVTINYYQLPGTDSPAGWDRYICMGGKETWKPDFGRHTSFKTLKISGYAGDLAIEDVRGIWAYTDAIVSGSFTCSNPFLDDIFKMCERSARQNVQQGIISVDANREQSPWTADSWNIGNGLLYNHKNTMIMDKIIKDFIGEQHECGDFYACSPASTFRIPEWSMYVPMIIWQQYLFSGDKELLTSTYPNIQKFLEWIGEYQDETTHLIDPPTGSWTEGIRFSDYAGGKMNNEGYNVATNSQYYQNLRIASEISSVLGNKPKALEFACKAEAVKEGINKNLFVNDNCYLSKLGDEQAITLGCCWPLRFNIVPEGNKISVKNYIKEFGGSDIGGYGGDAFYNGLYMAGGMGDYIIKDLNRYRKMLETNATNWEQWEKGEYNHAWTSYPAYLFHKYISGIQPTSGAFETFDIKPELLGLTFAESHVATLKGFIRTRWEKVSASRLSLSCSIPANTTATVYLPKGNWQSIVITEGITTLWNDGLIIQDITGIRSVEEEMDYIRINAGSGSYDFEINGTFL